MFYHQTKLSSIRTTSGKDLMTRRASFNRAIIAHLKIEDQTAIIYKYQVLIIVRYSIRENRATQEQG